jgi:PrgI family protein
MTPTTPPAEAAAGGSGVVRIPADLDRPDRILLGLSARQLAILSAAGLAAWTLVWLLAGLLGLPAAATVAAPVGLVGIGLALGWRDGLPLDRLAASGLRWWWRPKRLVVAPDAIPPAPPWAGPPDPPVAPLAGPILGLQQFSGVVDLGGLGWALLCQATPVNLALRTPVEQQALLAGFARLLQALTQPVQLLVRNDRADLDPQISRLREQAAGLPDPGLEQAALAHAHWLARLAAQQQVRRRLLLGVFRQPPGTADPGSALARQAEQAAGLLAAAGVTLARLDGEAAGRVLQAAADPDSPPRPAGLAAAEAVITGRPT